MSSKSGPTVDIEYLAPNFLNWSYPALWPWSILTLIFPFASVAKAFFPYISSAISLFNEASQSSWFFTPSFFKSSPLLFRNSLPAWPGAFGSNSRGFIKSSSLIIFWSTRLFLYILNLWIFLSYAAVVVPVPSGKNFLVISPKLLLL